jgi:hypothetical protein
MEKSEGCMSRDIAILDMSQPAVRELAIQQIKRSRGLVWYCCKRCRKQRSLSQNSFYWSAIIPIIASGLSEVTGEDWDNDRTHDFLKARFLSVDVADKDGVVIGYVVRSTTALTTGEFSNYVSDIQVWAKDYLGITVPALRTSKTETAIRG